MTCLKHFLVLNILITFTKSINENKLPVPNFRNGTKLLTNNNGYYELTTTRIISGEEIDKIQTLKTGSIYLESNGSVKFSINVYKSSITSKIIGQDTSIFYKEMAGESKVNDLMLGFPKEYRDNVTRIINLGLNTSSKLNWAFVATWSKVKVSGAEENTFQVVLLTLPYLTGLNTAVLFAYASPLFLQGQSAEVSIEAGGKIYYLPGSGTKSVVKLSEDSNFPTNEVPGLWLYPLGHFDFLNTSVNYLNAPCTEGAIRHESQRCNKDLVCRAIRGKGFGRCLCPVGHVLVPATQNSCRSAGPVPGDAIDDTPWYAIDDTTLYAIIIACVCSVGLFILSVCCIKKCRDKKRRENTTTAASGDEDRSSSRPSGESKKGFASIMDMLMKGEKFNEVGSSVDSDYTQSFKTGSSAAASSQSRNSEKKSSMYRSDASSSWAPSSLGKSSSPGRSSVETSSTFS